MSASHPSSFDFDYTLDGVCQRVSVVLNDADPARPNRRWSKEFLRATLRDAMYLMAKVAPRHFTTTEEFFLEPGECLQKLPEGCDELRQIVCIVDTKTGEDVTVSEVSEDTATRNASYPSGCAEGCGSALSNVTYTARVSAAGFFNIQPIPEDANRYKVTALCMSVDSFSKPGGVCTELPETVRYLVAPMVQLVAGMALMNNRDNPAIVAQAQAHLGQFAQLLQLSRAQRALVAQAVESVT